MTNTPNPADGKKICKGCGKEKPINDFHLNKSLRDRRLSKCKVCKNFADRDRYLSSGGVRTPARVAYAEANKEKIYYYQKLRNSKEPEKQKARSTVAMAIKKGLLIKRPCEMCNELKVDFHHSNGYEKENWLVGRWLCRKHHHQVHREARAKQYELQR